MSSFNFNRKVMIRFSGNEKHKKVKVDYERQKLFIFEKGINEVPDNVLQSSYFERLVQCGHVVPVGTFAKIKKSHKIEPELEVIDSEKVESEIKAAKGKL